MRILHCIPVAEHGGAENQLCYLSEGLVALGHEVHVAVLTDGPVGARLRAGGIPVHALGARPAYDPSLVTALHGVIKRTRADLVQTWLRRMDVAGGLAALLARRPWIYSERTVWRPGGVRQAIRRRLIEHASAVVANSENAAATWRAALPGRRVHVVPNVVPLDPIADAPRAERSALGLPDDAELILYVGRFAPPKNIELLADVLAGVLARRPRAFALCCGDGELLAEFRRTIGARGVSGRCLTPGFRTDVWSLLKAADALIATSRWEGRPNALLEAMACGCPVVASAIAGHRELLDEHTALLFAPDSIGEGIAALERALDDPEAARARAGLAFARVEAQSPKRIARAYQAIYAELVGGQRLRA